MENYLPIGAGLLVGTLIGLTGMGGGAIMTPFLILIMKMDPVLAIGTDLCFSAITKWFGGLQHRRQGSVNLRMVGWLALGSLPASFLTSSLILSVAGKGRETNPFIARFLGLVLILVSLYTLARAMDWIQVKQDENWPPSWALAVIGAAGGGLVGLTSVGSGTVIMASLLILYAIPPAQMVGLDVMHGALLTTVPAGVYALNAQVDWGLAFLLLLGSIPGAWLGTRLVKIVPQRMVRLALSLLLLLAGVKLFVF